MTKEVMWSLTFTIFSVICASSVLHTSDGVCCPRRDFPNFGCLSCRGCNIFCCNCGDRCQPDCHFGRKTDSADDSENKTTDQRSLSTISFTKNYNASMEIFISLDTNADGVVCFAEAWHHFTKLKTSIAVHGPFQPVVVSNQLMIVFSREFEKMDKNGDGVVSPAEMDDSLI